MRCTTERFFPGDNHPTLDGGERLTSLLPLQAQRAREVRSKDEGHRCRRLVNNSRDNLGLTTHFAVSQSIKEVVQSLVDDGLVQYDKIGSSNCTYSAISRFREAHIFRVDQSFGVFPRNKVLWWVPFHPETSYNASHHVDHLFCGRLGTKQT